MCVPGTTVSMWPGENRVKTSWDFSCPIISFHDIPGNCLVMLEGLNLAPFVCVPVTSAPVYSEAKGKT